MPVGYRAARKRKFVGLVGACRRGGQHYTFVVSNNFLGNDYRPELLKEAQLVANDPPFKGHVTVKIVESQPTAAAQLAAQQRDH